MNIKYNLLKTMAGNTRLLDYYYKHRKPSEEKQIVRLSAQMSRFDTIQDTSPLLELKKKIKDEGFIWFSHYGGMSDYRLYGIGETLFGKFSAPVYDYPAVEHGVVFFEKPWSDVELTGRASCVTFGPFRKKILRRYFNFPVFEAGPYIQYAKPYYNKKRLSEWKEKLGSVLLVIPSHGIDGGEVFYNEIKYMEAIERHARNYNTVLVCSYFWDLDDPLMEKFKAAGYLVVSAGYREDPNFLRRQRTIIDVSDFVISDSIGTHIGYCYKLGKKTAMIDPLTRVAEETTFFRDQQMKKAGNAVKNGNQPEIERVMNYYWGNNISLTGRQLQCIKEINKEITERGQYWRHRYPRVSRELLEIYREKDLEKYELLFKALE